MTHKTVSSTTRFILAILGFFLLIILAYILYLNKDVPLSTMPTSTISAKRLTKTIADKSNCAGLEYETKVNGSYLISACDKSDLEGGAYQNASFSVMVFFSKAAMSDVERTLQAENEMYVRGQHYIVHENDYYGDSKSNLKRVKQKHAYSGFPGELMEN